MLTKARILEIKEAMNRLPLFEAIDFLMSAAYERGIQNVEEEEELSHEDIRSGGYPDDHSDAAEERDRRIYMDHLMSKND